MTRGSSCVIRKDNTSRGPVLDFPGWWKMTCLIPCLVMICRVLEWSGWITPIIPDQPKNHRMCGTSRVIFFFLSNQRYHGRD